MIKANSNYNVRPLKIEFCKESEEKIQNDYQILVDQVKALQPCVVNVNGRESSPIGAAYLKVGEVRDGVDSDLAGWGRGGLSYRGRPGRTI